MPTCHWCHVMERESFEDEEVAALLNEEFVAVKVDREERPGIDHLYMTVCQTLTGSGGWPLMIFVQKWPVREDGRLLARYRDGEAAIPAYLDDYACLAWGCIELFQTTQRLEHLQAARKWTDEAVRRFRVEKGGRFFFTGNDGETLLVRPKETYDGAMPSGNSVMAYVLLRLAGIARAEDYRRLGETVLQELSGAARRASTGHAMLLCAGLLALNETLNDRYDPNAAILVGPRLEKQAGPSWKTELPMAAEKEAIEGRATAYVCEGFACRRPVHTPQELRQDLVAASAASGAE